MPTQTRTTTPIDNSVPVGTDFVGGAEALPVRSAGPFDVVAGSDFAGGAVPLMAGVRQGEPDEERAA